MRGQLKEAGGDPGDARRGGRGAISGEKIGFHWRSGEGKVTRLPGGAGGSAGRCACAGWSGGRWLDWAGLSVTGRETRLRAGLGAWERGERAAGEAERWTGPGASCCGPQGRERARAGLRKREKGWAGSG